MHDFLNQLNTVVEKNTLFNEQFSLDSIRISLDSFQDVFQDKGSIEQRFANSPGKCVFWCVRKYDNEVEFLYYKTIFSDYLSIDSIRIGLGSFQDVFQDKGVIGQRFANVPCKYVCSLKCLMCKVVLALG